MSNDVHDLISRYLEGVSTPEERASLAAAIGSDRNSMRAFVAYVRVHSLLWEIEREACGADGLSAKPRAGGQWSRWIGLLTRVAACLIVGLAIALALVHFLKEMPSDVANVIGTVSRTTASAQIHRLGTIAQLSRGMPIRCGDLVDVGGADEQSSVVLTLAAKGELALGAGARLDMLAGDRIALEAGRLHCRISPQTEHFCVQLAPVNAVVRVLGTEFFVEILEHREEDSMSKKHVMTAALITVLSGSVGVSPAGGEEVLLNYLLP